jgi:hypothetical protein
MQQDTRRLTVAFEHLQCAYEEIMQAIGQPERSIAEAAVGRALTHLDLVWRRLEHERQKDSRTAVGVEVERAYTASRMAWQGAHDLLNRWPRQHTQALDEVRSDLLEALDTTSRICTPASRAPAVTAPEQQMPEQPMSQQLESR